MILELLKENKIKEAIELLQSKAKEDVEKYAHEFNNARDIRNTQVGRRQNKRTKNEEIAVTKIPIPFQRKIVRTASVFLFGSPIQLVPNEENEASKAITYLWNDLRMDSLLLNLCQTVKSETEATIIFYEAKKEDQVIIKARLLTNQHGKVYPYFDSYGDMTAFGWEFKTMENKKEISYLYLFTADNKYVFKQESSDWIIIHELSGKNQFGKIPVVYLSQKRPEWWEVQELIDRYEMSFSKFCDTNDYFASPMYKAKGSVTSMPEKDETGKMIKLDIVETPDGKIINSDLDFLTWDHAPEALKLEFELSKGLIYNLTDTPDLSFDNVKGLGNVSGIALKLLFLSPVLKSYWDQGKYKTAISRIINLMKSGLKNVLNKNGNTLDDLQFDVVFSSVLPENIKEVVEILTEATAGKPIMSQQTAIANNPYVKNGEEEVNKIKEESDQETLLNLGESAI